MKNIIIMKSRLFSFFRYGIYSLIFCAFSAVSAQSYSVTVYLDPDDGSGGVVTGEGSYASGSTVTLTALPASGYHFAKWEDDDGNYFYDESISFTITRDYELIIVPESDAS